MAYRTRALAQVGHTNCSPALVSMVMHRVKPSHSKSVRASQSVRGFASNCLQVTVINFTSLPQICFALICSNRIPLNMVQENSVPTRRSNHCPNTLLSPSNCLETPSKCLFVAPKLPSMPLQMPFKYSLIALYCWRLRIFCVYVLFRLHQLRDLFFMSFSPRIMRLWGNHGGFR